MIENRSNELDRFKREINLSAFAASMGYRLDREKSSRNCVVMADGEGDKIAITRQANGHWTYFSVRDDADNGTIIDFLQRRSGKGLGETRKMLRPWIGAAANPPVDHRLYAQNVAVVERDAVAMLDQWHRTSGIDHGHAFLESRGLGPALADRRFVGTVRCDERGNAVFPHRDPSGNLLGFERRNHDFKGFSIGGTKGLWMSSAEADDTRLVICESPIDCMAYHLLRGDPQTRYVATGGAISPAQLDMLRTACGTEARLRIVVATDRDEAGEHLARQILDAMPAGQASRDLPPEKDWADVLAVSGRHAHRQRLGGYRRV